MLRFKKSEIAFMEHHGLEPSDFLDVRGSRPCEWKVLAKEMGYPFVISDDCKRGHRIRTRKNSCCQCNPAAIQFLRRQSQPGWVYLAYSPAGQFIKVGSTKDIEERLFDLNNQGYAENKDWILVGRAFVEHMGRVEHAIQSLIPGKIEGLGYLHRFGTSSVREAFACAPKTAWWHFIRAANVASGQNIWKHPELKSL